MTASTAHSSQENPPQSQTDQTSEMEDPPQSPHAMAEAALAEAVAERELKTKKRQQIDEHNNDPALSNSRDNSKSKRSRDSPDDDIQKQISDKWKQVGDFETNNVDLQDCKDIQIALKSTDCILKHEIEDVIRMGLEGFHELESCRRELAHFRDLAESRGRELQRIQASEGQSRAAVSNLLRAVETAKSEVRESSRAAQTEARLRGEISALRSERDAAMATAAESRRRVNLLEEELRLVKSKLARVAQEKVKMERDSRAAISLARSLDNHSSMDNDFYKRKAAEMSDRLQAQQSLVAEQKLQMDEMRRQIERSVSQNKLAQLRADKNKTRY